MYIYLLRRKNWKSGNNIAKSQNAFNSLGAVPSFAKPKLRTIQASQCETMLAPDSRYRVLDQLRRRGWNEDRLSRNIEIYRVEFHGAPLAKIVGSFSRHFLVSRESFAPCSLQCKEKLWCLNISIPRLRRRFSLEGLTKRNVSSSATISAVKLERKTQGW